MPTCPHLATVAALADGTLPAEEREAAAEHIAGCEECEAALLEAVELSAVAAGVGMERTKGER